MSYYPSGPSVNDPYRQPPVPAPSPGPTNTQTERRLTPALANLCFFLAVIAFFSMSVAAELGHWGFFATEIVGEGSLAVVAVLFCLVGRFNLRTTFSLRGLNWLTVVLCVVAGVAGQFAVRFPAALNQWAMQIFGPFPVNSLIPTPSDLPGRLLLFLVVVLLAPLCEETLNRGVVLAGYRQLSFGRTIFFVGLLFGLFHLYPFRFGYTFLLGMVLAYLVLTTGSILSSVACHFGFNLLGGLSPWLLDWLNQLSRDNGRNLLEDSNDLNFQSVVSTIPVSLFAAGVFFLLIRAITRRTARRRPEIELNYFGLTRRIRPAQAQSGPYYGPDRRYVYGRYGYDRAEMPQAVVPGDWSGYPPPVPGYGWEAPPPALPLPTMERSWWRLSFVPILLFYAFTAYAEIGQRLIGTRTTTPKPPAIVQRVELTDSSTIKVISWREK